MLGIMGSERNADERYTAAGSLKSITYPTRGVTTFTYESNDYEVGTYIDPAANEGTPPDTYPGSANLSYDMSHRGSVTSKELDLHGLVLGNIGQTGTVTVKGHFRLTKKIEDINEASLEAYFQLLTVGKVDIKLPRCTGSPSNNYPCLVLDGDGRGFSYSNTYTLSRGRYQWLAFTDNPDVADINATYEWIIDAHVQPREGETNEKEDRLMYRVGGGIRIKSIVDYAPESQVPTTTSYEYHYRDWNQSEAVSEIHSYGKRMVIHLMLFLKDRFNKVKERPAYRVFKLCMTAGTHMLTTTVSQLVITEFTKTKIRWGGPHTNLKIIQTPNEGVNIDILISRCRRFQLSLRSTGPFPIQVMEISGGKLTTKLADRNVPAWL